MKVKNLLSAFLCSVAFLGLSAKADLYTELGIGGWDPASKFNNPGDSLIGVNRVVDIWNGVTPEGAFGEANFFKANPLPTGGVPVTLSPALAFDWKDDAAPFDAIDNTSGKYLYALAKYGNTSYIFYIGDKKEVFSVPLNIEADQRGLSHVSVFTGTPNVPDGGLTALLLGLALSGMGATRRFLKK